jgi:sugar lactone lactonase YvrE
MGVAVDAIGNVYVADTYSNKIRKITSAGVVSTLAGTGAAGSADGAGGAATFNFPFGVAVDAIGNVYVADTYNRKIRKITPSGSVSTIAGTGTDGSADGAGGAATFSLPFGVAVDANGNVYVADYGNKKIRKLTPQ